MTRLLALFCSMVLMLAAPVYGGGPFVCNIDGVRTDTRTTLVGGVEASTLRITWRTDSEGSDLSHYEVWARRGREATRLVIEPRAGFCPKLVSHDLVMDYDPTASYYVEIHSTDGSLIGIPVPIVR